MFNGLGILLSQTPIANMEPIWKCLTRPILLHFLETNFSQIAPFIHYSGSFSPISWNKLLASLALRKISCIIFARKNSQEIVQCIRRVQSMQILQTLWPFLMSHFIVGNYFCGLFDDVHAVHIFVLAHLLKESIHFSYDPKNLKQPPDSPSLNGRTIR